MEVYTEILKTEIKFVNHNGAAEILRDSMKFLW